MKDEVRVAISIEHDQNLDVTVDDIAKFAAQGVQDNLGSFKAAFVTGRWLGGKLSELPVDPITTWFLGEGSDQSIPAFVKFRVKGQDILGINAGDFEGFDIRVRRSAAGYSRSIGHVGLSGDQWRAILPGNSVMDRKRPGDTPLWPSAIAAVAFLLGVAGPDPR